MALLLVFWLGGVSGAWAQAPAAGLARIGAAAAVKGLVQATAPGAAVGRVVESGRPLFLNDHVTTDAAARLQVLLLDQTVFTMGPNSDMVLDEFVYDPSNDSGKVTARVTKGVFRFVTGKVARKDPASMKVNLPAGTIGIRGTIAAGEVSDQGSTVILLGPGVHNNANENPGAISVSNAGGSVLLSQPGFGTTLAQGQPPTPPANMSQQLQHILGNLGGPGPSPSQTSASPAPGASPTQTSGQATASGGVLAGTGVEILAISNSLNGTQQQASQTAATTSGGIIDGISTWDQVTNTVLTGLANYQAMAIPAACSGSLCTGNENFSSSMLVDFAARTFSGSLSIQNTNPTVVSPFTSFSGDFNSVNPASQATVSLSANSGADSRFFSAPEGPTTFTFMNRGGVAAQDLRTDLHFFHFDTNSGGQSATITGSATATAGPLN